MSTIKIENLTKRFDGLLAVNSVGLEVAAGEVVCLLGPSGCGKTTTLRMIAGLESASEGEIFLDGHRVNHLPPAKRNIAMVFQFYALYPSLTVAENIGFPLHAEKIPDADIAARVQRVAEQLELVDSLHRRPGHLAEGEKQRVAVGRAIIRDPSCFLFDEPLSRLDIEQRQTMRTKIKEVLAGLSKATVIVTHDQVEALSMADRIAVMRGGEIEQIASPHDIFTTPNNVFVAGFIGTPAMNLFDSILLSREGNKGEFTLGGQTFSLHAVPGLERLEPGSSVTVGIRPRAFDLAPESTPGTLAGSIELIEPMGAETLVHVLCEGQELRVVVDRKVRPVEGETLHLKFRAGKALLFNQNGELIRP